MEDIIPILSKLGVDVLKEFVIPEGIKCIKDVIDYIKESNDNPADEEMVSMILLAQKGKKIIRIPDKYLSPKLSYELMQYGKFIGKENYTEKNNCLSCMSVEKVIHLYVPMDNDNNGIPDYLDMKKRYEAEIEVNEV